MTKPVESQTNTVRDGEIPVESAETENAAATEAVDDALNGDDAQEAESDAPAEPAAEERTAELRHGRAGTRLVRSAPKGSVRSIEIGGRPGVTLRVITYNVVDSCGSVWLPGCLDKGLNARLPQLVWGHKWSDVVGRATAFRESGNGPDLDFYFDDFDAVPRARQADAQVKSGTIDDCSVGFGWDYLWRPPTDDEEKRWPGVREIIIEAELDEVSLVLRGAVPGAKVLTSRSSQRNMVIDRESAGEIVVQFAQGNSTLLEALNALQSAAIEIPIAKPEETKEPETEPTITEPVVEPEVSVTPPTNPEAETALAENAEANDSQATAEAAEAQAIADAEVTAQAEAQQAADAQASADAQTAEAALDADLAAALQVVGGF